MPDWNQIAVRQVFIDQILKKFSSTNRKLVDIVVNAREEWERMSKYDLVKKLNRTDCPITEEVVAYISIYLRYNMVKTEEEVLAELEGANRELAKFWKQRRYKKKKTLR